MINCKFIADSLKAFISNNQYNSELEFAIFTSTNPSSKSYLSTRVKLADELNIKVRVFYFEELANKEFESIINDLTSNEIPFIIDQPCPRYANLDIIQRHQFNLEKIVHHGTFVAALTPTAIAIYLIMYCYGLLSNKHVVIIGKSKTVGLSLAQYLLRCDLTITVISTPIDDLKSITKTADVIIVAAGVPNLITPDHIKEDAYIIDVGINIVDNKVTGDVSPLTYGKTVNYTPVPGGVGPITNLSLFLRLINMKYRNLDYPSLFKYFGLLKKK